MSQTPQPPLGGRYELRRQLASTPAARVYLAQDLELGRPVAIKVLGPDLARDPQIVEKFRQAANSAASVHHPNIVTIYDWGDDQGAVYVAMEYVDGASLADTLHDTGRLPTAATINMGVRVAEALDAAHQGGIVHGSLKPRDVLLGRDSSVKVTDFGTATAGLAALAGPVAVATYGAPEQLQGQPADARSDLYALGALLYEAITGNPPFTGADATAISQRKLSERVIPPSVSATGVPPGFDAIVDRLLERDPARRYATGSDVAADLIRLGETAQIPLIEPTQAVPVAAAAPVLPPPVVPPPEDNKKKSSATGWIIAAIIVLVLAIGGLIAWAVSQNEDSKAELVQVPAVVGARAADAKAAIDGAGFSATTVPEPNDQFGEGLVFEQAPLAGTQARKGSVVVLKVSSGPTTTTTSSTSSTTTSSTTTSTTSTTTTTTTTVPPTTPTT